MNQFKIFPLLLLLLPLLEISASRCLQNCGNTTVNYPFGFSPTCKIPLHCSKSNSIISIGRFSVRNTSSDRIVINVPSSCTRSIQSVTEFFGPNYALTKKNGLFLQDCNNSTSRCSIPTELLLNRLSQSKCVGSRVENVSCYADVHAGGDFLTEFEIKAAGCKSLFMTVMYEAQAQAQAENVTALVFSEAELGWWLDGPCNCSPNATCTNITSPVTGGPGFRCACDEGYEGDGFAGGRGCWKVAACGSSNYMSGKCGSRAKIGALVGGIIAGGSIMAFIGIIVFLLQRCYCKSSTTQKKCTKRLLSQASLDVPLYPYKTIERATENFSDANRLGTGAYGTVYVGNFSNGECIAVKKIKHPEPETIEQVMNEVKMISSVNHPNLVRLLGCCIDEGEQILVYEFMPNGTLAQHLQRQRGPGLPWTIRLAIATETAKAIAYLHYVVNPPICHRDIKSSNILLDHQFNAKIADFGLSRTIVSDLSHISTAPQGTPGYVDPQYHQNYHLSDKSDVYSFGVVLMEILTAMKVVDFNRPQSEVNLAALAVDRIAKGKLEEIIDPFLNIQKESWMFASVQKVAELAFRCLAFHRDMRPSMMEVADELEQIRISCWAPKDGDVVVMQALLSPLFEDRMMKSEGKSKRLVVLSEKVEEKVNSPVSVQENSISEQSTPSSSSLLGYSNH